MLRSLKLVVRSYTQKIKFYSEKNSILKKIHRFFCVIFFLISQLKETAHYCKIFCSNLDLKYMKKNAALLGRLV